MTPASSTLELPRHPARDRVNAEADVHVAVAQVRRHLGYRVLSVGNREAVPGDHDHVLRGGQPLDSRVNVGETGLALSKTIASPEPVEEVP